MKNWRGNLITNVSSIKEALARINDLGVSSNVLFVINEKNELLGSVSDGDIRRGLLNNAVIFDPITSVMNTDCKKIFERGGSSYNHVKPLFKQGIHTIPVVNEFNIIVDIIFSNEFQDNLPVDAIIMAGGKGERLLQYTQDTPKPLLKVGDKPIIEHNIDRLKKFGIKQYHISVNYLADMIIDYFKDGSDKDISIHYLHESKPLGTIGSLSLAKKFENEILLLMNSDLLTNIDFSDLYKEFIDSDADMAVASIPHHVDLPYAIFDLKENLVTSLCEKPRYTYFANAGIYMFKKKLTNYIPYNEPFDATDFMEAIIKNGHRLIHFPILGYWLDIGRVNDYLKAQDDVNNIKW